ncbi:MAG: hypothetical protein ACK4FK_08230 [Ferrovibrio sp.]|uniref:hypothetical protein n=1 Tax=Ferrovibrio sp. TaxID=1917215 RepID=UPI00391A5AA0
MSAVDAWKAASQFIHDNGAQHSLLVIVRRPTIFQRDWLDLYSPHHIDRDCDDLSSVVKTAFPYKIAAIPGLGRAAIYDRYLKARRRYLARPGHAREGWGTYFQRLVSYGPNHVNQLERVIEKINLWPRAEAALVMHLSDPGQDSPQRRGGPCWQFGEIIWHLDDSLDLVVVYRNHDYLNKALGNFLALGMLLEFIANATGKRPGNLICHSVHAYTPRKNLLGRLIAVVR